MFFKSRVLFCTILQAECVKLREYVVYIKSFHTVNLFWIDSNISKTEHVYVSRHVLRHVPQIPSIEKLSLDFSFDFKMAF